MQVGLGEPGAGEPAEQDRVESFRGPSGTVEDGGERRAERDLPYPRSGDGSGDGDEGGAGLVRGARLPEPVGAVAGDEGEVGECLDVVDQGGAAVDSAFMGAWRAALRAGGTPLSQRTSEVDSLDT